VFAFNLTGAGLAAPGQTLWFPTCVAGATCTGTNGERVRFLRKKATNVFTVRLTAQGLAFSRPLSSVGVTVTLSLGGLDDLDHANCQTFAKRRWVTCR